MIGSNSSPHLFSTATFVTEIRLFEYLRDSLKCFRRRQETEERNQLKDPNQTQYDRFSMESLFEIATIRRGTALLEDLLASSKINFNELYKVQKNQRGLFALSAIGIREIGNEISKWLSLKDFKAFVLICKRTYSPLLDFPKHLQLLEILLKKKEFELILKLLRKFPSININAKFEIDLLVEKKTINIGSVLRSAVFYNEIALFQYLVDIKLDFSVENNIAIQLASANGHFQIFSTLLDDSRVDPSANQNYAIRRASDEGHSNIVFRLLEDPRVDPSAKLNHAICWASARGNLEIVCRLLRESRVNPADGLFTNFAISMASTLGNANIVSRLLDDSRVDPSSNSNMAIRMASENGNYDIACRLLEDVRVNPSDDDNMSIRKASEKGRYSIVCKLLEDPRVDPSGGNNFAIRKASEAGHLDIVCRLLEDSRTDPSSEDNFAIRKSAEKGHYKVVCRLLKDPRVDPSVSDNYAIRMASNGGFMNVFCRLLEDPRVDPALFTTSQEIRMEIDEDLLEVTVY